MTHALISHIVTYQDSTGTIVRQNISPVGSGQTVPAPTTGYSLLEVSDFSSGIILDPKEYIIDLSSDPYCRLFTDAEWVVVNVPTYVECAAIITSELILSDHTQSLDASNAGHSTASQDAWRTYREGLRAFTSTMTGNYILDNWPTKPNDGSTAYDQYFDPLAEIIYKTTSRHNPPRTMAVDAALLNYGGGEDRNKRITGDIASFALYGYSAQPVVDRHGVTGQFGFSGLDVAISRSVTLDVGYIGIVGSTIDGTGDQYQFRGELAAQAFVGSSVDVSMGHAITADPMYSAVTGLYASAESTQPHPAYGVAAESGYFTYTVQGHRSEPPPAALTLSPSYLVTTPTFAVST